MLLWFQHHDFSSEEFPNASLKQSLEQFSKFNWSKELDHFSNAEQKKEDCCPPGMGLVHGAVHILHICPESAENSSVFYHYQEPAKVCGILPYHASRSQHSRSFPLLHIKDIMTAHYTRDHSQICQLLKEHR